MATYTKEELEAAKKFLENLRLNGVYSPKGEKFFGSGNPDDFVKDFMDMINNVKK